MRETLDRFGSEEPAGPGGVAVRLNEGTHELADVVRALDGANIAIANLEVHAPSLDDVFLAKTGRRLEGAGDDEAEPTGEDEQLVHQGGGREAEVEPARR
jgi:ABC-2 type transport system ATP-binding protein